MKREKAKDRPGDGVLPFDRSVGYQIRTTHRLLQRYLQQKIEPHGMTPGMWYFLRALWHEDGLTQRELSEIVGTMEPTTLTAIRSMERSGLVHRVRNRDDRRKINVYLTPRGKDLRLKLLPLAREVVEDALAGFSDDEKGALFRYLNAVQRNVQKRIEDEAAAGEK
jgi:DNA-binding MarR family transcriptional regulator